jgi:hypothetical protein
MKDLKHIRRFNESEENLNISDVSVSDITKGFKFKMNGEDLIIVKDYEKDGQDRYVKLDRIEYNKKTGKSAYVVLDKDVILNYLKSH